ncbi:MAG: hypothetical protein K8T91_10945 [Planctomycetes bacterium]|nr:hypothetical protein [Planctomycetota bacterium]
MEANQESYNRPMSDNVKPLQLARFKELYEEEKQRFRELTERAKSFVWISSLFLGAYVVRMETIVQLARSSVIVFFVILIAWATFFLAVGFALSAIQIRQMSGINFPEPMALELDSHAGDEDKLYISYMGDLAGATKKNGEQNEKRATDLKVSGRCLMAGILATFVFLIATVIHSPQGGNHNDQRGTIPATGAATVGTGN